jgi:fido (protein-threonine AMPylation protein)
MPRTPLGRAAAASRAWDTRRTALFDALARVLATHRETNPVLDDDRTAALPLFEAYFSNFIEGTEFTVDEALDIVRRNRIPEHRPRDAHDVLGTHQVVSDPDAMSRVPRDGDEFLACLRERHRTVMQARPDMRPGQFKELRNPAGSTVFVDPELTEVTLRHALEYRDGLDTAFGRAAFMLFAVSEVHPFDDGNGRVARIMMNAELHAAGEHRIVVPTVYRDEYLNGLRRLSRQSDPTLLVDVLDYAWRWTSQMDWSDDETVVDWLALTEALHDSHDRDIDSRRLRLPSEVVLPDHGFGHENDPAALGDRPQPRQGPSP